MSWRDGNLSCWNLAEAARLQLDPELWDRSIDLCVELCETAPALRMLPAIGGCAVFEDRPRRLRGIPRLPLVGCSTTFFPGWVSFDAADVTFDTAGCELAGALCAGALVTRANGRSPTNWIAGVGFPFLVTGGRVTITWNRAGLAVLPLRAILDYPRLVELGEDVLEPRAPAAERAT